MPWRIPCRLGQHAQRDGLIEMRFDIRLHPLDCVDDPSYPCAHLGRGYQRSMAVLDLRCESIPGIIALLPYKMRDCEITECWTAKISRLLGKYR